MDDSNSVLLLFSFFIGVLLGGIFYWLYSSLKLGGFHKIANEIVAKANLEAETLRQRAALAIKQAQVEQQRELELIKQQERKKFLQEEERLKQREDKLEARFNTIDKKLFEIERKENYLNLTRNQLEEERIQIQNQQKILVSELEKVAGFSALEARELLLEKLTQDVRNDAAHMARRITKEAEEQAEDIARRIIVTSINRLAVSTVSEATVSTVTIPTEEMKGRIIGKEGRNIRALERATGVNFIIDDTPGAVVISGFDPFRMHIAKQALAELIADGRIHPTRIEEIVEKVQKEMHKKLRQYGEEAALKAGAMNLHPELIILLGKLKLRFSFGQNVLDHSLEVSHLMGLVAGELGLDIRLAKRMGLLHDIGKAVSHEIEGSHALVGHDLALKYGEHPDVAVGIGCHHGEMVPTTLEASFLSGIDALSAVRPGSRIEAVEEYVKRLKKLEELALRCPGVDKAYALQAGREIRVSVLPESVDDAETMKLANDLAKMIEKELTYPGKIKVTVVREKRVTSYAL